MNTSATSPTTPTFPYFLDYDLATPEGIKAAESALAERQTALDNLQAAIDSRKQLDQQRAATSTSTTNPRSEAEIHQALHVGRLLDLNALMVQRETEHVLSDVQLAIETLANMVDLLHMGQESAWIERVEGKGLAAILRAFASRLEQVNPFIDPDRMEVVE